ncbi:MAG: molybdopterin biosynthesis protein [Halodesulfurarchaeum sp.]
MSGGREFRDLASKAEARRVMEDLDLEPEPEQVPLAECGGRVLAERVDAAIDVPGFDRAGMDGYAVRARDTFKADERDPIELSVVGAVHAGEAPAVEVDDGEAAIISTGAVLPDGADAVVPVERTEDREERVAIQASVAPGDSVMAAGADIAAGERALGPGTHLTAREIGLLSALGIEAVPVRGRPRVGIISTGDELVRPGEQLDHDRGQIYDVNTATIARAVTESGGEPVTYPHVGDDREEMERLLTEAAEECELVLSSGSTSASAVDVVYRVIEERGELLLHGVSVKPGKPMLVGRLGGAAYVGLPGFPVSALTIFRTFVAPRIREAAGLPEPRTATVSGQMAVRERYSEGRTRFLPVGLVADAAGDTLVYPVDKGSGATTSLVEADGFVEVDADTEYLAAGEPVSVQLFSPEVRPPTVLGVGEDDPLLSSMLDELGRPRYLGVGSREGVRRFRYGVPDFVVAADSTSRSPEGVQIATWDREWGLIVPDGNPAGITDLASLLDGEHRFVNRDRDSSLRKAFEGALKDLADERGVDEGELQGAIDGFDFAVRAHESPARRVRRGDADVGLGLRVTAEALGLGFVSLGWETLQVVLAAERREKDGVAELEAVMTGGLQERLEDRVGYRRG